VDAANVYGECSLYRFIVPIYCYRLLRTRVFVLWFVLQHVILACLWLRCIPRHRESPPTTTSKVILDIRAIVHRKHYVMLPNSSKCHHQYNAVCQVIPFKWQPRVTLYYLGTEQEIPFYFLPYPEDRIRHDSCICCVHIRDFILPSFDTNKVTWPDFRKQCTILNNTKYFFNNATSGKETASVVWWSEFLATDPEVRVRFAVLPDFLRSSASGTGSIQPREYNRAATWKKKQRLLSRKTRIRP
jgi:hypothetical protein